MPIHCSIPIHSPSLAEFRKLDFGIMKHAFDCQNSIGSLADERLYQADFAARLTKSGFQVDREVEITLTHKDFQKSLFVDHVIDRKAVYELKVAKCLTDAHRSQLLTYLYLLQLERGKLINFATPKVQSVFVNAAISATERHKFSVDATHYRGSDLLLQIMVELVNDWGTSLSIGLYHEAVTCMLGGIFIVEAMLPMKREGIELGNQRFHLVSPEDAFQITAFTYPGPGFPSHLERLVSMSPLRQIEWVNISHHQLQLVTIKNRVTDRKQFS